MNKALKYRLYPTRKQRETLQFTLDRNRELYNAALEERRQAYRMSGISICYNDQSAQLPAIKEVRPEYLETEKQKPSPKTFSSTGWQSSEVGAQPEEGFPS